MREPLVVGIFGMGDMGSAVAGALATHGMRAMTCLDGRSARSAERAGRAAVATVDTMEALVRNIDIALSIVPPASAEMVANLVATCISDRTKPLLYADLNAITPVRTRAIGTRLEAAGIKYVDGGLIGPPPSRGRPSLVVSGPNAACMQPFDGVGMELRIVGDRIGQASEMKLMFSALNKGFNALGAAVHIGAERLGFADALAEELHQRIGPLSERISEQLPYLPTHAVRYADEMREVADLFACTDLPEGFHQAAAAIFRLLAETPFANETRDDVYVIRTARDVTRAVAMSNPK